MTTTITRPPPRALQFQLATPADDPALRKLLRDSSFPGPLQLSFQREPSFFHAAHIEAGPRGLSQTLLARDPTGQILATGTRTIRPTHLNGRIQPVAYLGLLRFNSNRIRPRTLLQGYAAMAQLPAPSHLTPQLHYTSIMADNHRARRLLESHLPGLPRYLPLTPFSTFILPVMRLPAPAPLPSLVTRVHLPPPAEYISIESPRSPADLTGHLAQHPANLTPAWSPEELLSPSLISFSIYSGSNLRSTLSLWDTSDHKQITIHRYNPALALARPILNLLSPLTRRAKLPSPGQPLRLAYLSHLAITDPADFLPLLHAALAEARSRQFDYLAIGLPTDDSRANLLRQKFPHHELHSLLYQVTFNNSPPLTLDSPLHPELALL